jgi:hypothetical protein
MGHKKQDETKENGAPRIPDHVRPLIRRLMMTGGGRLDSMEWALVHAFYQMSKGREVENAARKPGRKKTP